MKKYKIAAILMIIHGGFMELGGIFAMIPALLIGTDKYDIGQYFEFKLPYFQDNLYMMMVMGAIYGVFRLIGAIGLLKNRMWGLVLSVEMSRNVQSGNTQNLKSSAAPVRLPAAPAPTPGTSRVAVPAGCVYRP